MEVENVIGEVYYQCFKFNGWVNNEDVNREEEYT